MTSDAVGREELVSLQEVPYIHGAAAGPALLAEARGRANEMIAIGFEISAIADGAEVAKDTVRNILSGKKNARKVTCRQIIALDPSEPIMGHRVPNVIVTRMLDEMRACGLSLQWIYRTAGINPKTGVSFTGERLSWGNYAKLRRVYDAFFDSDLVSEEGIDGSSS